MGGMVLDKKWAELSFNQKRHRIMHVVKMKRLAFWKIVGKDIQHYYLNLSLAEENIDGYAKEILERYLWFLEHVHDVNYTVHGKEEKIRLINKLLGD